MKPPLSTPILFIIFNRPLQTGRVFDEIRKARPERLFIAADGPRNGKIGEDELCKATRSVVQSIDWPCKAETRFQDKNLGCKQHVSSSIAWFFEQVEEGIILEDDCLPSPSFFIFCEKMLEQYSNVPAVMTVNGGNFLAFSSDSLLKQNYHFSRCPYIWGWATWRRAWKMYDLSMSQLDTFSKSEQAQKLFMRRKDLLYWSRHFKHIREKHIDTWDAQWVHTVMSNSGLAISPHVNMIENIGFGPGATHTLSENPHAQKAAELPEPYRGPLALEADQKLDLVLMKKIYNPPLWKKIVLRLQLHL